LPILNLNQIKNHNRPRNLHENHSREKDSHVHVLTNFRVSGKKKSKELKKNGVGSSSAGTAITQSL
jgi:hypothetical protein